MSDTHLAEMENRSLHVRDLLLFTIEEALRYKPDDRWRQLSNEEYISQYLIYDLSFPRMYGKTWAVNNIESMLEDLDDKRVVFLDSREFGANYRGRVRPFGKKAKVIVVEETFDSRHIKMIAENWLLFGYKKYPKIIVVRTKPYVEDYKRG